LLEIHHFGAGGGDVLLGTLCSRVGEFNGSPVKKWDQLPAAFEVLDNPFGIGLAERVRGFAFERFGDGLSAR